jgi:hypothetical protein
LILINAFNSWHKILSSQFQCANFCILTYSTGENMTFFEMLRTSFLVLTVAGLATGCNEQSGSSSSETETRSPGVSVPYDPTISLGAKITDLVVENTSNEEQKNVPFTFGQAFIKGNFLPQEGLAGKLNDGSVIPLQVDVKALHTDGSVRHAVISGVMPTLKASLSETIELTKATLSDSGIADVTPSELVTEGVSADVNVTLDGVSYSVSLDELLKTSNVKSWLKGPVTNEFVIGSSLKASNGTVHPHLAARFAVRSYRGLNKTKIDVILENGWTYEPNPRDFTYDVQVNIAGQNVYAKSALTHFHHTRWHKNFWSGSAPKVNVKHNVPYLINTKAVPNYDQSFKTSEATIAAVKANFDKSNNGPMGNGIAAAYMPTTGGRPEIGINPSWHVMALLTQDKRLKEVSSGMGDLAGSWGVHYRDQTTGEPMSLADYPYMTAIGGTYADKNPVTGQVELLPGCKEACGNTNTADVSHQAAFAYIPYLLSGEHFYMEELMFYGMWNIGTANPAYREYGKGILKYEQVRGQAWALRTFFDAAYILPENVRHKTHFKQLVAENMKWYNDNYTNNTQANIFGVLTNGYAMAYNSGTGLAPWQDDFFTSAVGRGAEYEFPGALELLKWKAKYTVGRMTDPGTCWILGAVYSYNIKATPESQFFTSFREAYLASSSAEITSTTCASAEMAAAVGEKQGSMTGYPSATAGYPSNFQPAAAYSADSGIENGSKAWQVFMGRTVKPDYSTDPQFSIIPRSK